MQGYIKEHLCIVRCNCMMIYVEKRAFQSGTERADKVR